MVMNTTTIRGMENYSYNRDTKTLYRGHKVVNPIEGVYTMKCKSITWFKSPEQLHEMTIPNHKPLAAKKRVMKRLIDRVGILRDKAEGMLYVDICKKYRCSMSTVSQCGSLS